MQLYLGCGPKPFHPQHLKVMEQYPGKWTYIDKYVKDEGITNLDATALPFFKKSVKVIYSSHLLEHISHRKVKEVLGHWFYLLDDGGYLHLNVPDFEWACRQFLRVLQSEREGLTASTYYNKTIDGTEHDFMQIFYGSHAHEGEYHLSGFTKDYLERLLREIGFRKVDILQEFEAHDMGCLIVKARK